MSLAAEGLGACATPPVDGGPTVPDRALLRRFPQLRGKLPWRPLGTFPTAIEPLARLTKHLGCGPLLVKRDDLSGERYGGNKVRKLEILLADAHARGCRSILAVGAVGSNQVVATALYGRQMGLDVFGVVVDQPNHHYVRNNLRCAVGLGSRLVLAPHALAVPMVVAWLARVQWRRTGVAPYRLAPGGSSALGTLGFVDAGLEIAEQVAMGVAPEPDRIVVPVASTGTMAGLLLGIRLGGLRSRLIGVGVVHRSVANPWLVASRARAAQALLRRMDPSLPRPELRAADAQVVAGFEGRGYAHDTPEALDAMRLARDVEGLQLDPTYTGKAMSALVAGLARRERLTSTTLFVNTFNSRPLPALAPARDIGAELPPRLRRYL